MRKVLLLFMLLMSITLVEAQNYDTLLIQGMSQNAAFHYCANEYDGVVVCGEPNCNCQWNVNFGGYFYDDNIILLNSEYNYYVTYIGFVSRQFNVFFHTPWEISPFYESILWKRQGEPIQLRVEPIYDLEEYECLWSNGSNNWNIEVTEPGIYSVTITSVYGCGSATYTIEVRDNVEITLATCDLSSNLNVVTWQTTPAQAAYISQVIIKRDGMQVGTAPYEDGQFIDNIGSDAASRTYTIIGVMPNGEQCPIEFESYPKETIHMSYLLGVGGTIDLTWNTPTGYNLMGYNICEWNPGKDGELTVIDYVGAGVTSYTCFESQFNNGNVVVQGVEEGKTESRLLSNRSWETVGLDEIEGKARRFEMYPNPTNGPVTIKSSGTDSQQEFNVTICNSMGQIIASGTTQDGVFTTEKLSSGIYIVNFGGNVQKLVVE